MKVTWIDEVDSDSIRIEDEYGECLFEGNSWDLNLDSLEFIFRQLGIQIEKEYV